MSGRGVLDFIPGGGGRGGGVTGPPSRGQLLVEGGGGDVITDHTDRFVGFHG